MSRVIALDEPDESSALVGDVNFHTDWEDVIFHTGESPDKQDNFEELALQKVQELNDLRDKTKKDFKKLDSVDGNDWIAKKLTLKPLEDRWLTITPVEFVQVLENIGAEDAVTYLDAFSININPNVWNMMVLKKAKKQLRGNPVYLIIVYLPTQVAPGANCMDEWLPDQIGHVSVRPKWKTYLCPCFRGAKTEFRFNWSTAHKLFTSVPEDQVYMIKALADTGAESGVFNTVVGHGIMDVAWKSIEPHYWFERIMGLLFLLVLHAISTEYRKGWCPGTYLSVTAAVLAIRGMGLPIIELLMAFKMYGCQGVVKFVTTYNVGLFLMETGTGILLLMIVYETWGGGPCVDDKCYLIIHPVMLAFCIAARWLEFILAMLCTKYFGENVLPAFHACTSTEAIAYIVFLLVVYTMVLQAYIALPIGENWDDLADGYIPWIAGLKMYRMLFLGDFDMFELSGANATLEATLTAGGIQGSVDDAEIDARYDHGVKIGFIIGTVTITIMFMNVGIGLLSNLYDEAKARKHQLCAHYKADYAVKLLFWRHFFGPACHLLHCEKEDNLDHVNDEFGIWILNDKNQLRDAQDDTYSLVQQVKDQNDKLMAKFSVLPLSMSR